MNWSSEPMVIAKRHRTKTPAVTPAIHDDLACVMVVQRMRRTSRRKPVTTISAECSK